MLQARVPDYCTTGSRSTAFVNTGKASIRNVVLIALLLIKHRIFSNAACDRVSKCGLLLENGAITPSPPRSVVLRFWQSFKFTVPGGEKKMCCLNTEPLLPPTPSCAPQRVPAEPSGHCDRACGLSHSSDGKAVPSPTPHPRVILSWWRRCCSGCCWVTWMANASLLATPSVCSRDPVLQAGVRGLVQVKWREGALSWGMFFRWKTVLLGVPPGTLLGLGVGAQQIMTCRDAIGWGERLCLPLKAHPDPAPGHQPYTSLSRTQRMGGLSRWHPSATPRAESTHKDVGNESRREQNLFCHHRTKPPSTPIPILATLFLWCCNSWLGFRDKWWFLLTVPRDTHD